MPRTDGLPRSVDELCQATAAGRRLKYLLFWGHQPRRDGAVGSGCLSQWWPAPFTVDGTRHATAEHFMMAGKARLFGDQSIAAKVLAAPSPGAAKALGRQVRGFDQATWEQNRFELVVTANVAKFDQHRDLREYLLGTGSRVLVEASPLDRIWGIGLAAADPAAENPSQWRGLNLLGFALIDARERLSTA